MKKSALLISALLTLAACGGGDVARSDRENLNYEEGERIFTQLLTQPAQVPVSFVYDGRQYTGLGELRQISSDVKKTKKGQEATLQFELDPQVSVTLQALLNHEFGEVEYTLFFKNTSAGETSKVLEQVKSVSLNFAGADPVLRGCLGDHHNKYAAYEKDLTQEEVSFRSENGRATHKVFPYFDLVHGDGGTLLALGWAGTWNATFKAEGNQTNWTAENCNEFRSVLLPGELMRTALVVMLPYKGRNADDATNLWREWFLKYNTPKANGKGDDVKPFSTTCWAGDTGLPNSDGSISERFYTWKRTLERLQYEHIDIDFRWFDAGWYLDPAKQTVMSDWWGTIGTWEIDTVKWPGKTFRESNEACHKAGMKVLVWFEPERVTHVDDLVKNYGYKPEWAISNGHDVFTNDLGDPECLAWTLGRITKMMGENAVDLFREDNNSDPGTTWPKKDNMEEERLGLPRHGAAENKAIQGHYALWDGILKFCAENGKCTFIDNCASGGGRNDIESLRRSMPFMRSDADRTTTVLRLSMSSTFNKWIPFHGANTKESKNELDGGIPGGSTVYVTRASWLPIYNISESWTHDVLMDYDLKRKTLGEWKKYNHLLLKDYYVLTPWHRHDDATGWSVFAYNDRKTGESIVQAFRKEDCTEPHFVAKLPYAEENAIYKVEDIDTGEVMTLKGSELSGTGISFTLDTPKSCAVLHIQKQ